MICSFTFWFCYIQKITMTIIYLRNPVCLVVYYYVPVIHCTVMPCLVMIDGANIVKLKESRAQKVFSWIKRFLSDSVGESGPWRVGEDVRTRNLRILFIFRFWAHIPHSGLFMNFMEKENAAAVTTQDGQRN